VLHSELSEAKSQTDMEAADVKTGGEEGESEVKVGHPADDCDICITTTNGIRTVAEETSVKNKFTPIEETMSNNQNKEDGEDVQKDAFELVESVNSQEDTDDESDDEEMQQFLHLINKAEKKNQKKISAVQTFQFGSTSRVDWRNVDMDDPESDTTDTEDEDDTTETRRFLSLMGNSRQPKPEQIQKPMVTIKWQDGKVVGLPANIKVTRVAQGEEARMKHEDELKRRRREHLELIRREGPTTTTCSGKRKFEDRMTLSEAKAEDFTDTKDYVDFIQAKLKNVNIKIIK